MSVQLEVTIHEVSRNFIIFADDGTWNGGKQVAKAMLPKARAGERYRLTIDTDTTWELGELLAAEKIA